MGTSFYHVQYVKGTHPYAIIQHLQTQPHTASRGLLATVASYPASLLAAIGHALAGLSRTGGGGVGVVAGLPFPVQTVLLGLVLAGLGVLLRTLSFVGRLGGRVPVAGEVVAEVPVE